MANEGTSLRGMDNNFLFLCVLQVTLANESIVLYMCEGKVLMDKVVYSLKAQGKSEEVTGCGGEVTLFLNANTTGHIAVLIAKNGMLH